MGANASEPNIFGKRDSTLRGDAVPSLLYRLKLNRIRIDTDIRLREGSSETIHAQLPARRDLREALFTTDQLLVSTERLAEASSREGFYLAMQDVLANVVGAEHFALFEAESDGSEWVMTAHCGVASSTASVVDSDAFCHALRIRDVVETRATLAAHAPVVYVPLLAFNEVVAMVVVFEWLPQKQQGTLQESRSVLEMLKMNGGMILRTVTPHVNGEC